MKKVINITTIFQFELSIMEKTRIIPLDGTLDSYNIGRCIDNIQHLFYISKKPVTILLNSPGGSVDAGLSLYDFIKSNKNLDIRTKCTGMAASMAAILLGAGKQGTRSATKNSRIMIHQPSSGYIGKASDIEVHAKETARIRALLNKLISEDTKQPLNKVAKDTMGDLWMTAEEAVKYGLVDKVV